jgi:hypothetical protein
MNSSEQVNVVVTYYVCVGEVVCISDKASLPVTVGLCCFSQCLKAGIGLMPYIRLTIYCCLPITL